jgi:hypothetical protein
MLLQVEQVAVEMAHNLSLAVRLLELLIAVAVVVEAGELLVLVVAVSLSLDTLPNSASLLELDLPDQRQLLELTK